MPSKRDTLGEDHYRSEFHVTVHDLGFKTKGDDGRSAHDFNDTDWTDATVYNGVMDRRDGRFQLQMQWVDVNNEGHRVILPHQVVEAINRAHKTIIKRSLSNRGRKGHETRVADGTVHPIFQLGGQKDE